MRKRYRVLLLAAVVAVVTVPLGFLLAVPAQTASAAGTRSDAIASSVVLSRREPLLASSSAASPAARQMLESIKLVAVGTLLLGFAAIARKA